MRSRAGRRTVWAAFAVLLMVWAASACTSAPDCASVIRFEGPSSGELVLLGTATGDTTLPPPIRRGTAGPPPAPAYRFVVRRASAMLPSAQAFDGLAGPGPPFPWNGQLGSPALSAGESFYVVPRGHDSTCRPTEWSRGEWVPAGAHAVFVVSRAEFYLGIPVFEVLGDFSAYPYGAALGRTAAVENVPDDVSEWLTAREYFQLLSGLPPMDDTRSREEQLLQIENDFRTGPERFIWTFPGTEIIERARLWASSKPTI
jgi:hypothetical protein